MKVTRVVEKMKPLAHKISDRHGETAYLANTTRLTNAGLMLGQRRRRWTNIKLALVKRVVFSGYAARAG